MASSRLSLAFRIFQGGRLVREETLTQAVIKLGKVASAHLRVDDEAVSRMHAIIEVAGDEVSIIDLGSTRGTFVNGAKINKARLADGDTIEVGDTRIELGIQLAAAVPPPIPAARIAPPAPAPAPIATPVARVAPVFAAAPAPDDEPGARAVEVAAMLGDSVVQVKHCMDPRSGKITPATWGFVAGGLIALAASASAFYMSVDNAAFNKGKLDYVTRVQHRPAYSYRPRELGAGVDVMAFGGLALGLFGMTAGLARMRSERRSPYFRIGTAPGVELPIEQAPAASFPLVAPSGDDFVFNYGAGIEGELTVDGTTTPLSELAAAGRARPSLTTAGAIEVPIPAHGKIRARAGQTTFLVSGVAKPRRHEAPLLALENRALAYFAGSLAAHLGVWALLNQVPVEDTGANIDLASQEDISQRIEGAQKEDQPPPKLDPEDTGVDGGAAEREAAKMKLEEGAAGKPDAKQAEGHMRVKDNQLDPQLARQEAIEEARNAGFLGSVKLQAAAGMGSPVTDADLSSGFDAANVYGPLYGAEGEGKGNFGYGRTGFGAGGGCTQEPCGIIGTGNRYATIGGGLHAGGNWDGIGGGPHGRGHRGAVPPPRVGNPTSSPGYDRAIIRRYIRQHLNEISYCYEKQLLANPSLAGEVLVSFLITPTGNVQASTGKGMDQSVATCVANVVGSIQFPKPPEGDSVQVNYPFNFHGTGQ